RPGGGCAAAGGGWRHEGRGGGGRVASGGVLEGGADAERVELRADLAQRAGLCLGVVAVQAVDAAVRVLDEAVGGEDGAGPVVGGGGGDAAVRLPGQDDPVRLGGLDAVQGVVPDLGERTVVADEEIAGDLLGTEERVVGQGDAVGLGDAAVRLVRQGVRGDGGEEEAVAFVVPVDQDELGAVGAAEDGCLLQGMFGQGGGDQVQVPDAVGEFGEVVLGVARQVGAGPGVGEFAGEDVGVRGKALG